MISKAIWLRRELYKVIILISVYLEIVCNYPSIELIYKNTQMWELKLGKQEVFIVVYIIWHLPILQEVNTDTIGTNNTGHAGSPKVNPRLIL